VPNGRGTLNVMKRVHVLFNRDLQVRKGLRRKEMSSQAIARTVGMRVLGERTLQAGTV